MRTTIDPCREHAPMPPIRGMERTWSYGGAAGRALCPSRAATTAAGAARAAAVSAHVVPAPHWCPTATKASGALLQSSFWHSMCLRTAALSSWGWYGHAAGAVPAGAVRTPARGRPLKPHRPHRLALTLRGGCLRRSFAPPPPPVALQCAEENVRRGDSCWTSARRCCRTCLPLLRCLPPTPRAAPSSSWSDELSRYG
jgi:hypothetical protein